jgi:NAD(P)-dependent dehydrogenase (short-subunit alcohol dehydrogenase family)
MTKAYIVTGPTSGMGRVAALELAKHSMVVLVGRDREKLAQLQEIIAQRGQRAVSIVCDLSELSSVRRAAADIIALNLPIAGLLNNAGVQQMRPTQNGRGWDMSFATNHLGPFALTEALASHLPDGANVLFVASAVEDPERKPAKAAGFRGGRYLSAEASARGEWLPGGSIHPGFDAYATSKLAILAAALALSRETPRLRINAVEPGFTPATGLARDAGPAVRFLATYLVPLLMPFMRFLSTPQVAGRLLARLVSDTSGRTGVYYDEHGEPMSGSPAASDPAFQDRVVTETRTLLALSPQHAWVDFPPRTGIRNVRFGASAWSVIGGETFQLQGALHRAAQDALGGVDPGDRAPLLVLIGGAVGFAEHQPRLFRPLERGALAIVQAVHAGLIGAVQPGIPALGLASAALQHVQCRDGLAHASLVDGAVAGDDRIGGGGGVGGPDPGSQTASPVALHRGAAAPEV